MPQVFISILFKLFFFLLSDRDLKLWSGIPKIITTQNLSICNCKHGWNIGRVECLFNFVSNLQCTDFDIAL